MALQSIGLKTQLWNNNIKSILLLLSCPLLFLFVFFCAAWALESVFYHHEEKHLINPTISTHKSPEGNYYVTTGEIWSDDTALESYHSSLTAALHDISVIYGYILSIIFAWFLLTWFMQSAMIIRATGAHRVTRSDAPELYNLLENLCISRGMKMPQLYIIEHQALNAFASGTHPENYMIGVTRGLLYQLNKTELEAVLAHELSHILNGDARLMQISLLFVDMFAHLGVPKESEKISGFRAIMVSMHHILWILMLPFYIAGHWLVLSVRFAISRRREYMADAGAVELTQSPDALISALHKISKHSHIDTVSPHVSAIFIEPSAGYMDYWHRSHPPISARIAALQTMGGRLHESAPITAKSSANPIVFGSKKR